MPYFSHDDIAQIATPPGPSPVGAVRISGDNAFSLLAAVVQDPAVIPSPVSARRVVDADVLLPLVPQGTDRPAAVPCPARLFLMPAPRTYTREDVAEIHLPGSPPILRAALRAVVTAGARAAAPGEFTFRAFRSGRLTLGQAEAVEALIRAGDDAERRRALVRLGDRDHAAIRRWRNALLDIAAQVEAALDFADEELDPDLEAGLAGLAADLAAAAGPLAGGSMDPAGRRVALVGATNAGKSSLFNALLEEDAVIVSPQPSTTRDSLRRRVRWDGIDLELVDTPGHDPHTSGAGGDAAARGLRLLGAGDLSLWVVDASRPLGPADVAVAGALSGAVFIVMNKNDLPARGVWQDAARLLDDAGATVLGGAAVSAAGGDGVAALRHEIARLAADLRGGDGWSRREALELAAARESCRRAADEFAGAGRLELAAEDLRHGVRCFSRLAGEGYAEEALERIFSRFCIGK